RVRKAREHLLARAEHVVALEIDRHDDAAGLGHAAHVVRRRYPGDRDLERDRDGAFERRRIARRVDEDLHRARGSRGMRACREREEDAPHVPGTTRWSAVVSANATTQATASPGRPACAASIASSSAMPAINAVTAG